MKSILDKVTELQRSISLGGSSGVVYQELLDKFQIERKMGYYFAKRFLISTGYSFKLGLNYVDFDTFSLESFLEANNILSFAPVEEVKGTCGIEGANLFPGEESNLYNILETIAKAETKGCLISDLSNLAGNQVHNYIDRLVGLDILVKRSVLPASGSGPCRISSKSTVVHSKQFAPFYDEASDEVRVVVSSSYLDKIHDLILNVLQQRNVKMVPVRDLARALGMSRWDMQALRNASLAQEKKEPPKVKFFLSNCQSYGPDGILSVPRLAWCVGSASDAAQLLDEGDGKLAFQCSRNMPLHETIALALASRPDGLTASDLRALTGVTLKRAAKLFTAFSKQFGYPVEKVQDGKQLKHKLMPKDPSQAQQQMQRIAHSKTARSAAASHYGIGGAGGIRAVTTVAAAAAHLKTVAASSSASSAPPTSSTTVTATATATACAVTVPAVPDSPEGGAAEDTKKAKGKGQGMVSDMQALNNSIILDFLAKTGGVASTADITAEVRTQHRKLRLQHLNALGDSIGASSMGGGVSGASSSVDRRTIDRTLQRLEHSLHHIASFPLLIPTGDAAAAMEADPALGEGQRDGQGQGAQEGEQVVLVVLASLEEEARQQAVEKYLARRFSTAAGAGGGGGDSHLEPDREFPDKSKSATRKRAAASDGKRQRRSRAAPSTGTDTGTGSARKKARVSVATRSWDSGSDDSASNYSDDDDASAASSSAESSSSSPLSAAEDSDSEDSTNADKRAGAVRGRGRGAATGEMLAGRTSRGVDQRKARKNALHQKKVLHDPHIFDNSNLLLPAPLTTSADVGSDGAPVPSPLLGLGEVESPGFLVRCLLFHHFLQACVLRVVSGPEAGGEHRREASALLLRSGEHVEVVLPALLLDLPLHYFLRTSAALRNALLVFFGLSSTDKQHSLAAQVARAVDENSTCRELIDADDTPAGALKELLAQYLGGPHCRAEHVAVLSALAAFGIVRPSLSADPADLGIVAEITRALRERLGLEAAGAPHEAATAATAAGSRPGPTLPRFGAAAVDLRSFAELASLLQLEECLAALTDSSNKELETALQRVFAQPHSLNPVPVGAWAQPKSGLDVYHHWLTVILPSLRLCWDGLRTVQDVTSMTHLGRHVLHYFEVERSDDASMSVAALEVPASAGEHGYFNNKLRMTYWGCPQLAHVWGDLAAELDASSSNSSSSAAGHSKRFAFSWRALLPGGLSAWRLQQQQQSMDMDAEWGTGAQHQHHAVFSLDMPRRSGLGLGLTAGNSTGHALAQHRKRAQAAAAEGSTGVGTGAARKRAKAGADPTDSAAAAAAGAAPVLARNAAASIANYNHPVRIDPELRRMEKRIFASTIGDGDGDGNGNGNDDAEGHAGAGGTTTCTQGEREGEMEGEMEMDSEVRDRELNQEQGGTETGAGAEEEGQDGDEEGDSQLEEEVRGLHELDEVEWTAKQIAIILEVVLVNFFTKKQGAKGPAAVAGGGASVPRVAGRTAAVSMDLPSSCLDCNWAETDFSLVSELLLSASIAASRVPDQKVARNRLLQCVKYRPRLLSVVAWVLCNKGAQLSSSLSRILNAVLAAKAETETGTGTGTGSRSGGVDGSSSSSSSSCSITLAAEDRRGALTTMLQTYAVPGLSKVGLQALQRHSLDVVRAVTKELLLLGLLRRCEQCGSEKCSQKPGPCRHNKRAFDLTEAFYDMQSDTLLGPFFFECVLGSSISSSSSSSCHTHLGAGQCSFLLEELHSSRSSPSFKLLAVTQFLCARPSSLACKLDLQLPEEQQQHQEVVVPAVTGDGANGGASVNASTTLSVQHSVVAAGLGGQQSKSSRSSSASSAAATSGGGRATVFEEVLLMGQDGACSHSSHRGEPLHSGFCEKPLNSLLHCDVTAFLQKPSTTSSQQQLQQQQTQDLLQCALDVSLRVPWVLQDGKSVNAALLCGLASKVLCVLAERPGAPAAVVHTALCILSAAQTTELLRVLERAGLVEEKRPTVTTHLSDPFEARQVLMRKPSPGAEAVSGYFVLNCC